LKQKLLFIKFSRKYTELIFLQQLPSTRASHNLCYCHFHLIIYHTHTRTHAHTQDLAWNYINSVLFIIHINLFTRLRIHRMLLLFHHIHAIAGNLNCSKNVALTWSASGIRVPRGRKDMRRRRFFKWLVAHLSIRTTFFPN